MIIDAHYHLEERMEPIGVLLDNMNRYGIDRVVLIPPLNTPFKIDWLTMKSTGPIQRMLNSRWQKPGLIIYGTTVRGGKYTIGVRRYPIYDNPDNGSVARAIQAHPDKFSGWIAVNPGVADPLAELEKRAREPGWIGVKTHPFMYRHPVAMLDDTAAYCVEKGWPILMHLGTDNVRGDYRYLPERHPKLKIIYAHAGIPFFKNLWEYAKAKNNVHVDLSCSLLETSILAEAIKELGPGKCLYGSDSPYGYPGADGSHDYGRVLKTILRLPVSDEDKERILEDNIRGIADIS
jgi:predicted TIM-barrel fold metal-dependent hydrolase